MKRGADFSIKAGHDKYSIKASVQRIGQDILVAVYGGDKPHIGAVAAAHPRPGLKDPKVTGATASVICFSGHKEDEIAKTISETLAAAANNRAVVTAGAHWDDIDEQGIKEVVKNSRIIAEKILKRINSEVSSQTDEP